MTHESDKDTLEKPDMRSVDKEVSDQEVQECCGLRDCVTVHIVMPLYLGSC